MNLHSQWIDGDQNTFGLKSDTETTLPDTNWKKKDNNNKKKTAKQKNSNKK